MDRKMIFKSSLVTLVLLGAMLVFIMPASAENDVVAEVDVEIVEETAEEEIDKYTGETVHGLPVISQEWLNLYAPGSYAVPGSYPGVNVKTDLGFRYIPSALLK